VPSHACLLFRLRTGGSPQGAAAGAVFDSDALDAEVPDPPPRVVRVNASHGRPPGIGAALSP
jgi:hypothetical protein